MGFKDYCKRLLTEEIITDDVTTSCDDVVGTILQAAEKNVPLFKPSKNPTRKSVPYWMDKCTAAVKERNKAKAKNKMQQRRDLTEWQAFYKLNDIARSVDRDAKK